MAITSFPFDNADTTEAQYGSLFRELQDNGVVASHGNSALQVSGHATQMRVLIQPGDIIVRGHMLQSTAVEERTVASAGLTARIDWVVAELDPTDNEITLVIVQGTPGAGAPALTQTATGIYQEPLAQLTVDPGVGVIAAGKISDRRRFAGTRIGCWTTDTRPSNPRKNQMGLNVTLGAHEYWTGSGWSNLIPSPVPNSTRWNGYTLTVSTTTPAGSPATDRIWIQPTS